MVGGGWWVVVAWSNLVSAQGPLLLGLGLKGLGPRLDNTALSLVIIDHVTILQPSDWSTVTSERLTRWVTQMSPELTKAMRSGL